MPPLDRELRLPPDRATLTQQDVWNWYGNIASEAELLGLDATARSLFEGYYRDAGLLRAWRRPFFRHHYTYPLLLATRAIFERRPRPRILDLGCGTGTQSLFFALLGADVVGVDMDAAALDVLALRKALYERHAGRELSITTRCGNVFELDFGALGPFDAVYSLFAFNMMQPSAALLERLAPHLRDDAILAIQDGNREHLFNRVFRRRFASSRVLRPIFGRLGFDDVSHVGAYAIPPIFWSLAPTSILTPLDRTLARSPLLAVSQLHLARRGTGLPATSKNEIHNG